MFGLWVCFQPIVEFVIYIIMYRYEADFFIINITDIVPRCTGSDA